MFKVGDWVRFNNGDVSLLVDTIDTNSKLPQIAFQTMKDLNLVDEDSMELWRPELGEWCWFKFDDYGGKYELGQFKEMFNNDLYVSMQNPTEAFKYCEPFIGILPSNAKEKRNEST